MKKLLITGASGILGQYLSKNFSKNYSLTGTQHSIKVLPDSFSIEEVDLSDFTQTKKLIEKINPDYIIHTVALTSVDECETNPEAAYRVNVESTKNLVRAIANTKTRFLYISTDHLFSGESSNYKEEDQAQPLNIYAKTKLEGERVALLHPNSLVIRTNFYGGHSERKPSFSSWIYNELQANRPISMFTDSFFTPISIIALGENIESLLKTDLVGIYNVVGTERLSKYEFGLKLAKTFQFPLELIKPSRIDDLKLKAKRPKDMSLSIEKIKNALPSYKTENVSEGLKRVKELGLI